MDCPPQKKKKILVFDPFTNFEGMFVPPYLLFLLKVHL